MRHPLLSTVRPSRRSVEAVRTAALSDDRVVAVRLKQVDVIGLDGDPAPRRDVQQDSARQ